MRLLEVSVPGIGWRGMAARRFRNEIDSDQNGNVGTRVTIGATNSPPGRLGIHLPEGLYDIGALHLATSAIDLLGRNPRALLRNEDPARSRIGKGSVERPPTAQVTAQCARRA